MPILPTEQQVRCMINICGGARVKNTWIDEAPEIIEIPQLRKAGEEPEKMDQMCQFFTLHYAEELDKKGLASVVTTSKFPHSYLLIPYKNEEGELDILVFDPTFGQFVKGHEDNVFIGTFDDYKGAFTDYINKGADT